LEDLEFKKRNFAPGPGNYDLQNKNNINHMNSERFSFGGETRARDTHAKEQAQKPGAGTYNQVYDPLMRTAPNFGFGSGTRAELKSLCTPGAGTYAPKKFIGEEGQKKTMH
jgi:hypothetical protein